MRTKPNNTKPGTSKPGTPKQDGSGEGTRKNIGRGGCYPPKKVPLKK